MTGKPNFVPVDKVVQLFVPLYHEKGVLAVRLGFLMNALAVRLNLLALREHERNSFSLPIIYFYRKAAIFLF